MSDQNDINSENVITERNSNPVSTTESNGNITSPAPNPEPQAQPPRANMWSMLKGLAFRMFIIYMVSSFFRRTPTPTDPSASTGQNSHQMPISQAPGLNIFPKHALLDMYIFLNEESTFTDFNNSASLFWFLPNIRYGDWESGDDKDGSFYKNDEIIASDTLKQNGTFYIHVYFVKSGKSPDPSSPLYSKKTTFNSSKVLTRFKRRAVSNTVNLLTGKTDGPILTEEDRLFHNMSAESDELTPVDKHGNANTKGQFIYLPAVTHWHPNLTIQLLDDHTAWTRGAIPPPLDDVIRFYGDSNEYYPSIFLNDYWNLHEDYQPVNMSTPVLNLRLCFSPISLFRLQLYLAQTLRNKYYGMFLGENTFKESDEEQDTLKKTLIETNPYLLGLTIIVSLVHSVFEILAFKNDIQFWRTRKSLEGLSVRSVFFNVFQSVIVMLYVFDNDTNFVVKMSIVVGLLIEIWKIKKVINVEIDYNQRWLDVIPRIHLVDKSSYVETDTKKYDQMAFRYLSWLLFPLLGGFAIYSLLYQEHRGWYSWVLSMLYGFLLTFGFIMMTPQLFINYKMKSVAHLPWRMLTYKALNTFIDDIFAFVIRMPTLYRLGCLRDDLIFFIFLYQRWIYPIDPKRLNEFGVSQEMLNNPQAGLEDNANAPALSSLDSSAANGSAQQELSSSGDVSEDKKSK